MVGEYLDPSRWYTWLDSAVTGPVPKRRAPFAALEDNPFDRAAYQRRGDRPMPGPPHLATGPEMIQSAMMLAPLPIMWAPKLATGALAAHNLLSGTVPAGDAEMPDDVKQLQRKLRDASHFGGEIDGQMGPETISAQQRMMPQQQSDEAERTNGAKAWHYLSEAGPVGAAIALAAGIKIKNLAQPASLIGAHHFPGVISPRFVNTHASLTGPNSSHLVYHRPDMASNTSAQFAHNMRLVAGYDGMPERLRNATAEEIRYIINNFQKDNLLFLHDHMPAAARENAKNWFSGGNNIVRDLATTYDVPRPSAAATVAALSPQREWNNNVSLAQRTIDIVTNRRNEVFDQRMLQAAEDTLAPRIRSEIEKIKGMRYSDIEDPALKALWVRIHDAAYNPPYYYRYSPAGERLGLVLTKDGVPARAVWGNFKTIENAIKGAESKGDPTTIAIDVFGAPHKSRSMYNNLLYPHATTGDVTADTHVVSAAWLRPLPGSSPQLLHNFGMSVPNAIDKIGNSRVSGIYGTYPLYVDSTAAAGLERNLLPSEMGGIAWQAGRMLFPPEIKRNEASVREIVATWQKHGIIGPGVNDARRKIIMQVGGFKDPLKFE
jgi:hypothetical protein